MKNTSQHFTEKSTKNRFKPKSVKSGEVFPSTLHAHKRLIHKRINTIYEVLRCFAKQGHKFCSHISLQIQKIALSLWRIGS